MKFITYSGFPLKRARKVSFWVAIPTGQVFKLQTRIITHPIAISGPVEKPNSSAPRQIAIARSLPVNNFPSVSILTLFLKPLRTRVWWVSATPISQGIPALYIEVRGDAPVPPSYPEINIVLAPAFTTPAAIVPTPDSATSLTEIRAFLLAFFKS